ncbi:3-hydroxyisobutyryl-CoA hydrolase, partial [hydrothermal vent metagenome]
GGGVGVSVHGKRRIAGDATLFAMPETGIGFYPDVGGSYFLPRLPGKLGTWLALTGARLNATDALYAKVATDYAPSDQHQMIINRLVDDAKISGDVAEIIDSLTGLPAASGLQQHHDEIDRIFANKCCEEIVKELARSGTDWAQKQGKILSGKSPTALKVTLRQMQEGANLDFRSAMRMELGLSMQFVAGVDFYEGVRALLIDRDNAPIWQPDHLSDVSEAVVNGYFVPLQQSEELGFLE